MPLQGQQHHDQDQRYQYEGQKKYSNPLYYNRNLHNFGLTRKTFIELKVIEVKVIRLGHIFKDFYILLDRSSIEVI